MKKTMFITSVIMVVVMAIALTTSSLAWFNAGGQSNVTTQSFKVTAFAGTSEGIEISHKDPQTGLYNWDTSLILTSTGNTNLMPLVPFSKKTTALAEADLLATLVGGHEAKYMTQAMYDADIDAFTDGDDDTTATYAAIYEAFKAAQPAQELSYANLVAFGFVSADTIGTVANAGADYTAYMIGNKFDNNGKFIDNIYRDGYYTDTFYIRNTSSGAYDSTTGKGAKEILLSAQINFKYEIWMGPNDDPTLTQPELREFDYTRALRGGTKYDTDATLCVAVLAKVSEFDTNMITYLNENSDTVLHDTAGDAWEIIAYADSKNWNTSANAAALTTGNIAMGMASDSFKLGARYDECFNYLSKNGLNKTSSEPLRPTRTYTLAEADLIAARTALSDENLIIATGDTFGNGDDIPATGVTLPADIKTIKVVAWYDGKTLVNNNAANADLKFDLKFNLEDVPAQNP